jgi:hypothetical protein
MINLRKYFIPILVCSLLISCSASRHAGITNVKQPLFSEPNENKWFIFYQDRFDAFNGNVLAPTEQYPQSALDGYKRAKEEWEMKVQKMNNFTMAFIVVGASLFLIVELVVSFNSMSSSSFSIK